MVASCTAESQTLLRFSVKKEIFFKNISSARIENMSKKKKVKSESRFNSKGKDEKLKAANSIGKKKVKQYTGVSKIKNKQNIRESVLSKSKSKQNVKDNVKSKFKSKPRVKDKIVVKPLNPEKMKIEDIKYVNKNKTLKRLNINKLSAMLNAKEGSMVLSKSNNRKLGSSLSLRERMLAQLKSSRFRFLNEQLYSSDSSQSKKYFQDDPQAFYAYHEGYKKQVERWPVNPLDVIIESIKKMPKDHVIADFGCGEAKLADSVSQTVHSFDLVAVNEKVQACDMANTPLLTGRVKVAVFCLSLMGSNLRDYLLEANRVLEKNGVLKIAEVESRFDKVDDFIKLMAIYGFTNTWKDLSNNLFYFMDFKKIKDVLKKDAKKLPTLTLKPCLYKKR